MADRAVSELVIQSSISFQNIAQNNQLSLEGFIETIEAEESYQALREQVREEMLFRGSRGKGWKRN